MNTVQCPKCTLRFEPDETASDTAVEIFCPQCGNRFPAVSETTGEPRSASQAA